MVVAAVSQPQPFLASMDAVSIFGSIVLVRTSASCHHRPAPSQDSWEHACPTAVTPELQSAVSTPRHFTTALEGLTPKGRSAAPPRASSARLRSKSLPGRPRSLAPKGIIRQERLAIMSANLWHASRTSRIRRTSCGGPDCPGYRDAGAPDSYHWHGSNALSSCVLQRALQHDDHIRQVSIAGL